MSSDANDPFDAIIDDTPEVPEPTHPSELENPDEHLDTNHIKTILAEKKALYRHGTYMTIVAVVMVVVAVQLTWMAAADFRHRNVTRSISFIIIAAGLSVFAVHFVKRALQSRREAEATLLPEPTREPDFSQLSNGQHFVDNLRHMHDDPSS